MIAADSEVDNRLEKLNFAHVVKDAKSVVGFSASANFELDGMSHKHGLVAKVQSQNGGLLSQILGFFRDEFFSG